MYGDRLDLLDSYNCSKTYFLDCTVLQGEFIAETFSSVAFPEVDFFGFDKSPTVELKHKSVSY